METIGVVVASIVIGLLTGFVLGEIVKLDTKEGVVERSNGQEVPQEDKAKEQERQEEQRQFDNLMRYDGTKQ